MLKSWLRKGVDLVMRFEIKLQSYKDKLLCSQQDLLGSISLFMYHKIKPQVKKPRPYLRMAVFVAVHAGICFVLLIVHIKINIPSSFTYHDAILNLYNFFSVKYIYFEERHLCFCRLKVPSKIT